MNKNIQYRYDTEMDCIHMASLDPGRGKYEGGWDINEDLRMGLTAEITTEGRCIGIEFWNAAEFLLPHLRPEEFRDSGIATALKVEYCRETDTVYIGNGRVGDYCEVVVEGWLAHYDSSDTGEYPVGEIVGISLERASIEFLPDLLRHESGEFWGPDKAERMRRLRRFRHDAGGGSGNTDAEGL